MPDLSPSDGPVDGAEPGPSIGSRVDWKLAVRAGQKVVPAGPKITAYTRQQTLTELAELSVAAEPHVRAITGLADGLPVPTAQLLSRQEWVAAAAASMSNMLGGTEKPTGLGAKIGAGAAGIQTGGLLALLSTAIVGQYDPFTFDEGTGSDGKLLLVVPNVIAVERALKVVPRDFRFWVCLHEVTHRVQFSASPWLRDYMRENVALITGETGESTSELLRRITEGVRKPDRPGGVLGVVSLLQTPEQYAAFERLLMLGTLLEGHADHVMDAVGPEQIPTVAAIRAAFDKRRAQPQSPVQRILRAVLGMDLKIQQYVQGKAFVDAVVEKVGMANFNAIFTGPDTLPRPAEIGEPHQWIDRVL